MKTLWIRFVRYVDYFLHHPKVGDIYVGDAADHLSQFRLEKAFHRIGGKSDDPYVVEGIGPNTYRFMVESDHMSYYRCEAEVLVFNMLERRYYWQPRSFQRRIPRAKFRNMILDGLITRIKP